MSREVLWSKIILEEFIRLAALTPDQEHIIRLRVAGVGRIKTADMLGMSVATVDRNIRELKLKYDQVQKHSLILPVRKRHSVKEKELDRT